METVAITALNPATASDYGIFVAGIALAVIFVLEILKSKYLPAVFRNNKHVILVLVVSGLVHLANTNFGQHLDIDTVQSQLGITALTTGAASGFYNLLFKKILDKAKGDQQ